MPRLLFICGRNRWRSPTAERVFAAYPGLECESAGVSADADTPVTHELIEWAEVIVVMEKAHRAKIARRFRPHLARKRIVCLDIPDRYQFMEPALIDELHAKAGRFLRFSAYGPRQTGCL